MAFSEAFKAGRFAWASAITAIFMVLDDFSMLAWDERQVESMKKV
jgi:hypothetical protein